MIQENAQRAQLGSCWQLIFIVIASHLLASSETFSNEPIYFSKMQEPPSGPTQTPFSHPQPEKLAEICREPIVGGVRISDYLGGMWPRYNLSPRRLPGKACCQNTPCRQMQHSFHFYRSSLKKKQNLPSAPRELIGVMNLPWGQNTPRQVLCDESIVRHGLKPTQIPFRQPQSTKSKLTFSMHSYGI